MALGVKPIPDWAPTGASEGDPFGGPVGLLLADPEKNHQRIHSVMQPAVDRFRALDEEQQSEFRDVLTRFTRIYSFLSQVVSFTDVKLERDYLFCRRLAQLVRQESAAGVDLGDSVELTHLRMKKTWAGDASLDVDDGEVITIYGRAGRTVRMEEVLLSEIVQRINDRFGTNISDVDRLFTDQVADDLVADARIQVEALANSEAAFGVGFDKTWMGALTGRMSANEKFAFQLLDNDELRGPCWTSIDPTSIGGHGSFANCTCGGTLLVGVTDTGGIYGLEADYATFSKRGERGDRDLWGQHLNNLLDRLGKAAAALVDWDFFTIDGKDICRISIDPSDHPVFETKGDQRVFWWRNPVGTDRIDDERDRDRVIARRW